MNTLKYLSLLIAIFLCMPLMAAAQKTVTIPLENPGEAGSLQLKMVRGSVQITGYDGEKVIILNNGEDEDDGPEVTEDGLRRITSGTGFEITKDGNAIKIGNVSIMHQSDFNIKVPHNFSLNIATVNGDVRVKNVTGELDLSSVNGDISLRNVSGSALVNTVSGDIDAEFNEVAPNNPMAFTNLNGDIDVALPANAAFTLKINSNWGDVYTDFKLDIIDKNHVTLGSDMYQVDINEKINAKVNGGGPEYLFKSLNGDIYIRKQ